MAGRIPFPQFLPLDPNKPLPKGHILPIHKPVSLPLAHDPSNKTPLESWDPGIPVPGKEITREEVDLFRVKSITLVRNSELDCPVQKWIRSIQETPIVQVVKTEDNQEEGTVTLQQMLPILQGVLVEVSFKRKGTHLVPLQESCHLSTHPCHAHPLPQQHTGWALSEELFTPSDALAAEKLKFITQLAQSSFLERSEERLLRKQNAFQQISKRLLQQHRMLAYALESASQLPCPPGVIDSYFASLSEEKGWNHLTHLYEAVNSILQKKLTQEHVSSGSTNSSSTSSIIAASLLLQQDRGLHPAERYTRWMVQLLRQGAENPETRFGKQLQEIYSFQLAHFLQKERETIASPDQVAQDMVEALEREIAILTDES